MELERAKNAVRNVKYGVFRKIVQIVFPFAIRTVMVQTLGVQYLGLNSLFTSILHVLNLAELGVGSAMVYSMYQPIVEDDTEKICALVRLYRTYYRVIGLVVAVAGLVLTPVLPLLIQDGKVPQDMDLTVLYLLNLSATVMSYWLFSYKNSILLAFQRTDVMSRIAIGADTFQSIVQLAILVLTKNYYLFLIAMIAAQILNNILTAFVVNRNYPEYLPKGRLPKEEVRTINRRIADLFTSKVGMVIVQDADTLVISAFLGLGMLAVYQNYYSILASVLSLMDILYQACLAGIGNSLITESKEKNYKDLELMTFIVVWAGCLCACLLLVLYQPFMTIWMGEELLLEFGPVMLLCGYFFILAFDRMFNMFKDAGGIWHSDRFRPLITALVNLGLNLAMVQFIGIYGIILSTMISTVLVGIPWLLHNMFHGIFQPEMLGGYVKRLIVDVVTAAAVVAVTYLLCSLVPGTGIVQLMGKALACVLITNILLLLVWGRRQEFDGCLGLLKRVVFDR